MSENEGQVAWAREEGHGVYADQVPITSARMVTPKVTRKRFEVIIHHEDAHVTVCVEPKSGEVDPEGIARAAAQAVFDKLIQVAPLTKLDIMLRGSEA